MSTVLQFKLPSTSHYTHAAAEGAHVANMHVYGLKERHRTMAQFMIANPNLGDIEIAAALGYSVPWVGVVRRSDMFRNYVAEVRGDLQTAVNNKIVNELGAMTTEALGRIREKLRDGPMATREILETADLGLRSMGYGSKEMRPAAAPQLHVHVSRDDLENARRRIGLGGASSAPVLVATSADYTTDEGNSNDWPAAPSEQQRG